MDSPSAIVNDSQVRGMDAGAEGSDQETRVESPFLSNKECHGMLEDIPAREHD